MLSWRVLSPPGGPRGVKRLSRRVGKSRKTLPVVGRSWEALPEDREGSAGTPRRLGGDGRPSRSAGRGRDILLEGREGQVALSEGQQGLGVPLEWTGGVGRPPGG